MPFTFNTTSGKTIESGSDLEALAKNNLHHLGKESYFELFGF